MDINTELNRAKELNNNDNPKAAIKILKPLYQLDPTNLEVILEVSTAFELRKQWKNARGMLAKAIKLNPEDCELWIRLSHLYLTEENLTTALKAIDKGLSVNKNAIPLLLQKSQLLAQSGQAEVMHTLIKNTIDLYPDHKNDLLLERATIYESLAYQPREDEDQVTDITGVGYSVSALQNAVQDLTDALKPENNNPQIKIKRARIYKLLQQYENAIDDYDDVIKSGDEHIEPFREFLQQEKDKCIDGGRNKRSQLAQSLREGMVNVEHKAELSQDDLMANSVLDAIAGQLAEGGDVMSLVEEIDDPDQMMAMSIANDILKNAREPNADFTPTNKSGYEKSAQKFCALAEKVLSKNGFTSLGDFEPKGLSQQLGKRLLLRIFSSQDQLTCAAAFRFKPPRPSFLVWLLLIIQRKWKAVNVIELVSETTDGHFIITNNTSDINPFRSGDTIDMFSLPVETPIREIIVAHTKRLLEFSQDEINLISNVEDLFSMQERLRAAKNSYRESIGFVTEDELKKMLGNQYDKYAEDIRKYLNKLSADTSQNYQLSEA